MTITEYKTIRARIEDQYGQDLAALDRIWALIHGDEKQLVDSSEPESPKKLGRPKKLSRSEAMKASWAKRKAEKVEATERLPKRSFAKFLVGAPIGGNGKD